MTSITSLTEEQTRLRTDVRGRVRIPAERRQALLAEFDRSGLSGAAFARLAGVEYQTFMSWIRSRRIRAAAGVPVSTAAACTQAGSAAAASGDGAAAPFASAAHADLPARTRRAPVVFLEASLPETRSAPALHVELPGGARIQIASAHQLAMAAELLRLLCHSDSRPC